jgi:hypothetical protein
MPNDAETRKDWEVIQEDVGISRTDRLRVLDGWLIRTVVTGVGVAMVFREAPAGG